jgi:fatty acid desaturase
MAAPRRVNGTTTVRERPGTSEFDQRHVQETGQRWVDLSREVKASGLLDLQVPRYIGRLAVNTLIFIGGAVVFFLLGDSWWSLLVAVWMGLYGGQSSFVWHDAGHKAMFKSKGASTFMGRVHANLVNGVSYGWWVNHHNRHHSHPNHLELDPDIGRRTVIFDHSQYSARSRWGKFVVRHQHVLFFVLLVTEGLKMHRTALQQLFGRKLKNPIAEGLLLAVHYVLFLGSVFWILSPVKAVAFVLVQQAVLGFYFGMLFAPNHKGLPVRTDAESLDWVERQVLTSRNIRPNPVIDFLYGGLNYQVEHHLFPSMPRMHLGKARKIVREFCVSNNIPYYEVGIVESYVDVADYLHDVSEPIRTGEFPPPVELDQAA